jgi:NADH dehydrogenase
MRVIIVGGGFAGLNVAKSLSQRRDLEVLLLDRRNHHLFQPLLYQVAMAGLSPAEIAVPIRSLFRKDTNLQVLLAAVHNVDLQARQVETDVGSFAYDYLVMACGAEHSYFGHDEWEPFAPGLKSLEQGTEIRRRILTAFERAETTNSNEERQAWLTFAIVGGGPTGVELSGALAEITRFTLRQDFRHFDPRSARVILIEAGPRILPSFADSLGQRARQDLEKMGVQVRTTTRVTSVTGEGLTMGNETLLAKTVIWAAGVKPSALNSKLGTPLDPQGRVLVEPDLSVPQHREVFVIGDQSSARGPQGKPLPGLAPVAMQQGRFVASQILADIKSRPRKEFIYLDKGQMATIGRKRAVVQVGKLHFSGRLAWWLWLLIHVYYLIGFRNRFLVICEWAFSYLTYRKGARLITRPNWRDDT